MFALLVVMNAHHKAFAPSKVALGVVVPSIYPGRNYDAQFENLSVWSIKWRSFLADILRDSKLFNSVLKLGQVWNSFDMYSQNC